MGRQVRMAAKGDDGREYAVVLNYPSIDVGDLSGPGTIEGIPTVATSTGKDLRRISKGVYEVMDTGVRITTTDPRAV